MLRNVLVALLILGVAAPSTLALDLPESPIQTSMLQEVNSPILADQDEWSFDEDNPEPAVDTDTDSEGEKSLAKTLLLSAVLPGAGEYYLGQKTKASYFFAAEALTWIGFASFRTYGNWKRDDMIKYAGDYASADLENKDDEFEDWVGFYDGVDEFNSLGRATDDRPYLPATGDTYWQWESSAQRAVYRDIKNSYRENHRRANFMLGIALANRIISVIDSWRSFRHIKSTIGGNDGWSYELKIDPFSKGDKVHLTLYPGF
ncbi:hypothetical protein GF356_04705 [candidate division GN15 bacterium]|nr:hypothetical protein [candidate division GN15 bacterium]